MLNLRLIPAILFFFGATTANAATSETYNFLPLALLLVANLTVGGLLFGALLIFFSAWRERRFIHQRATPRQPTKQTRRQRTEQLRQRASKH